MLMVIIKLLLLSALIQASLLAKKETECKLGYSTMFLIAMNEKHLKKEVGYPYLISLNNKTEKKRIFQKYKKYFLDNRTIDCKNKKLCTIIASDMIKNNITNLDLGAFQINYGFHKFKIENYFDLKKSYNISCSIASKYVNDKDLTFENIAKYHSQTRKYNQLYAKSLKKNYQKLLNYTKNANNE